MRRLTHPPARILIDTPAHRVHDMVPVVKTGRDGGAQGSHSTIVFSSKSLLLTIIYPRTPCPFIPYSLDGKAPFCSFFSGRKTGSSTSQLLLPRANPRSPTALLCCRTFISRFASQCGNAFFTIARPPRPGHWAIKDSPSSLHACPCFPVFHIDRGFQNAGDQSLNFHQAAGSRFHPGHFLKTLLRPLNYPHPDILVFWHR